eukprot:1143202-Pelagomonas_calceolata.AAC.7
MVEILLLTNHWVFSLCAGCNSILLMQGLQITKTTCMLQWKTRNRYWVVNSGFMPRQVLYMSTNWHFQALEKVKFKRDN